LHYFKSSLSVSFTADKTIEYSREAGQLPVAMTATGRLHAGIHCESVWLLQLDKTTEYEDRRRIRAQIRVIREKKLGQ